MPRDYPRISQTNRLPRVPYCPCGRVATWSITIQVSFLRGEDEHEPRCDEHKREITMPEPAGPTPHHGD